MSRRFETCCVNSSIVTRTSSEFAETSSILSETSATSENFSASPLLRLKTSIVEAALLAFKILETDFNVFLRRIVLKVKFIWNTRLEDRIRLQKLLHFLCVSRKDNHDFRTDVRCHGDGEPPDNMRNLSDKILPPLCSSLYAHHDKKHLLQHFTTKNPVAEQFHQKTPQISKKKRTVKRLSEWASITQLTREPHNPLGILLL